ncbi:hypothetical protein QTP88_016734 [Uroleucon formosanum]
MSKFSEEELIMIALILDEEAEINSKKRKRKRTLWVHDLWKKREQEERILGIYTLNTNDREAKCYVACMLLRFNVTTGNGSYNDKALEQLMARPNSNNETPTSVKTAIAVCEKQVDRDPCEKAVKFTKCIYAHKDEIIVKKKENRSVPPADRRWPFSVQGKHPASR